MQPLSAPLEGGVPQGTPPPLTHPGSGWPWCPVQAVLFQPLQAAGSPTLGSAGGLFLAASCLLSQTGLRESIKKHKFT